MVLAENLVCKIYIYEYCKRKEHKRKNLTMEMLRILPSRSLEEEDLVGAVMPSYRLNWLYLVELRSLMH